MDSLLLLSLCVCPASDFSPAQQLIGGKFCMLVQSCLGRVFSHFGMISSGDSKSQTQKRGRRSETGPLESHLIMMKMVLIALHVN